MNVLRCEWILYILQSILLDSVSITRPYILWLIAVYIYKTRFILWIRFALNHDNNIPFLLRFIVKLSESHIPFQQSNDHIDPKLHHRFHTNSRVPPSSNDLAIFATMISTTIEQQQQQTTIRPPPRALNSVRFLRGMTAIETSALTAILCGSSRPRLLIYRSNRPEIHRSNPRSVAEYGQDGTLSKARDSF